MIHLSEISLFVSTWRLSWLSWQWWRSDKTTHCPLDWLRLSSQSTKSTSQFNHTQSRICITSSDARGRWYTILSSCIRDYAVVCFNSDHSTWTQWTYRDKTFSHVPHCQLFHMYHIVIWNNCSWRWSSPLLKGLSHG